MNYTATDYQYMKRVMRLAASAQNTEDCPIASIITLGNSIIAESTNMVEHMHDVTLHSEIICISRSCQMLRTTNLSNVVMYCSHEPCPMCIEAIKLAKIPRIVFGSFRSKDSSPQVDIIGGILWLESSRMLSAFFSGKR
jgi:tRNA(Arg) A34 adenosine deaminase TadA